MDVFTGRIVDFLIRSGSATEDMRDVYVFGIEATISIGISFILTITIGLAFSIPLKMLVFFVPFSSMRMVAGGYHTKSVWSCVLFSFVIMVVISLMILKLTGNVSYILVFFFVVIAIAVTFVGAPFINKNNPLSNTEILRFMRYSRVSVLFFSIITLTLLVLSLGEYAFCVSLGMFTSAVSALVVFLEKILERRSVR